MQSYAKNNKSHFWKDIKTLKKTNKEIFSVVDGKTDQNEILNIFKNKYKTILDDLLSQTRPKTYDNILEKINNETHINNCKLYSKDINYAINKLKVGIGFDLVHSQHLRNVNNTYK